uniref:U1-type domain-containing protein n=1 Tax=Panagrolaimus sp. PS1159 TaxID=55785 RepID=A0AC35F7G8_9BILA
MISSLRQSLFKYLPSLMESRFSNPIVIVGGCTGTGKSDLGIEIAKKFNGEIISADSMQIYKGLDIVTNKVTKEEMAGIPHHLMSFYEPTQAEYNIQQFRKSALELIEDIWKRDKLPIIVGGTSYYIEGILFCQNLIETDREKSDILRKDLEKLSVDELYKKLQESDPEAANQVHRNNRYRVLRALEIFLLTGKKKSEIIEEQKASTSSDLDGGLRFSDSLYINVDSDLEVLNERLKNRIDKMAGKGLKKELEEFYDKYRESLQSHGIYQSIGIKEFIPYLKLTENQRKSEKGEKLFVEGCDQLTVRTVKYAKKQRLWFRQRLVRRKNIRNLPQLVAVNTTKADLFLSTIVPEVLTIVDRFINKKSLDLHTANNHFISDPMAFESDNEVVSQPGYLKRANQLYICDTCDMEIHSEVGWNSHLKGKKHKFNVKKAKRVAEEEQIIVVSKE